MSRQIDPYVAQVRNASYGKDVREAIARSMEETYDSCINGMTDEAKEALLDLLAELVIPASNGPALLSALESALYNTTWPVTNTLSHAATSNAAESVAKGGAYSATITADSGYTLTGATVSVTMGGTDITSTAYSNGTITISAVTGALVITVSAVTLTISSISAVYTQSGTVYDTDSLDSLKSSLVVTATATDTSTFTVPSADYTLSGTLAAGTSTITVTYAEKTTTFSVTVTAAIPSAYQRVEYIQSTGSEYIDTGVTGDQDTEAELSIQRLTAVATTARAFGDRYGTTNRAVMISTLNKGIYFGFSNADTNSTAAGQNAWDLNASQVLKLSKDGYSVDGTSKEYNQGTVHSSFSTPNTLAVFNARQNGSWGTGISAKLFELVIKKSGTEVFHGYPVYRKSDDEPGLYDTVSETFFTNGSGSGGFTVGGDV